MDLIPLTVTSEGAEKKSESLLLQYIIIKCGELSG